MTDFLKHWVDGPAKASIVEFVTRSATDGSDGFIPAADRVAAFDNDGTLWVEQPAPVQAPFLIAKLVELVRARPELAATEPFRSIVQQDQGFLGALARQEPKTVTAFLSGIGLAWEGTTPEAYEEEVRHYLRTNLDERYGRPYTDLVYQPMLELFDFLRAHDYRVYVCSGGGRDFMRAFSEEVLGVPRENVIGTAPEWEYRDGRLVRANALHGTLALGPGKPEHLYARIGRMPVFAAGNGDVDIEMLEVAKFGLVVVHDDAEREYDTTEGAELLLERAGIADWTMVSMKNDWMTVFEKGA